MRAKGRGEEKKMSEKKQAGSGLEVSGTEPEVFCGMCSARSS
jgi:hypothetical protein